MSYIGRKFCGTTGPSTSPILPQMCSAASTKCELLRLAGGRNPDQKLNGNRFSSSHRRLELPAAKRETRRFVHLRHDALIDFKAIDGSVFAQCSLKNYQLAALARRHA